MFKKITERILGFRNQEDEDINYNKEDKVFDREFIKFLEKEADRFLSSKKRADMLMGERYYDGRHDIIKRKRTAIGQGGEVTEVSNLPNNIIIDNQYARMADQKNNYLLSKELTFICEDEKFLREVKNILGPCFFKTLKAVGLDCFNCGVGYIYVYCDDFGKLSFKRISPYEIIPFKKEGESDSLDFALRIYNTEVYKDGDLSLIDKAELFLPQGIKRFIIKGGKFIPDGSGEIIPYLNYNGEAMDFGRVPIISFRQNEKEIPLILRVKELQDALNTVQSDFMNNLQEDARNTILVLKNYDGTNLGEFRKNLAKFGAVKVNS